MALPLQYRSPIDITCVHKLPLGPELWDFDHQLLLLVAPQVLISVYAVGAATNHSLSLSSSCERPGGSGLELYMTTYGIVMEIVFYTGAGLFFACLFIVFGSFFGHADSWSATATRIIRQHIVSKILLLDVFWRLQVVVWLYRAGGSGLAVPVTLGTLRSVSRAPIFLHCALDGGQATSLQTLRTGASN